MSRRFRTVAPIAAAAIAAVTTFVTAGQADCRFIVRVL
jgi:hypothetical protein